MANGLTRAVGGRLYNRSNIRKVALRNATFPNGSTNEGPSSMDLEIYIVDGDNGTGAVITVDLVLTSGDASLVGNYTTRQVTIPVSGTVVTETITLPTSVSENETWVFQLENSSFNGEIVTAQSQITMTVFDVATGIPAPTVTYEDDMTTITVNNNGNIKTAGSFNTTYYLPQGTTPPVRVFEGPGGTACAKCVIPASTANGGNRRSEMRFSSPTEFASSKTDWNVNYGAKYHVKLDTTTNSDAKNLFQTHSLTGAPVGSSPQWGLIVFGSGSLLQTKYDGIEPNQVALPGTPTGGDVMGKWLKIWTDVRFNHYNRTDYSDTPVPVPGWRDAFGRVYMTVGTANALPPDPKSNGTDVYQEGVNDIITILPVPYLSFLIPTNNVGPTTPKYGVYSRFSNGDTITLRVHYVSWQNQVLLTQDEV